ncbi:MAG: 2-hydroxyhepta-2,4-diene-1,7-dioate isomerase, partial [Hoeflea sp.]|nr:2-hydroxyhepta-2,4-diene-1,7-dioate isomerase [Hoeflea sp.]
MKLLRIGAPGQEKPAILDAAGKPRDLSSVVSDIAGEALLPESLARMAAIDPESLPELDQARIGPCVGRVGKFICIGL